MRFHEFLGLIIGAVLLGLALFPRADPPPPSPNTPVRILVAKHVLDPGHPLSFSDLAWQEWPRSLVLGGFFRDTAKLFGPDGRRRPVVRKRIAAGAPISAWKIDYATANGLPTGLNVPPGWRAASIRINATSGVAEFITPNDVVDVLSSHMVSGQLTTSVILRGVRVLAVDDMHPDREPHQPPITVTLLVDVEGAQRLDLARSLGRLSLILRAGGPDAPNLNFGLPHDVPRDRLWIGDFPIPTWMFQGAYPGIAQPPGIRPDAGIEILHQPHPPRGYVR